MSCMLDFDVINRGAVFNYVGARHLGNSERLDRYLMWFTLRGVYPRFFLIRVLYNSLCQGDGSTAWRIFLFGMMNFINVNFVPFERLHHFRQVFIHLEKNVNAEAIVGCVEKCSVKFFCKLFDLGL